MYNRISNHEAEAKTMSAAQAAELIKDGMKRYDAYQKATEEGFIVSANR